MRNTTITLLIALVLSTKWVNAAEKPNIILFLVDDMGLMDTSVPFVTDAKGKPVRYPLNEFYRTPNMEKTCGSGNPVYEFLRPFGLLAHSGLHHDWAELGSTQNNQLCGSGAQQQGATWPGTVELGWA